ncbi:hypothetical protein LWI29_003258 [Acer saccharum]|uniref:Prolyl endopeptidase-like n=1 Tax=Acer saccharum TaxID=4024 RepID=A0AA39VCP0_ACESA|nr:hypothetical protein LWI29_003258 [Acer saccharum]
MSKFIRCELIRISRNHNSQADALAKLASTSDMKLPRTITVFRLSTPSLPEDHPINVLIPDPVGESWMTPIMDYLRHGTLPEDKITAQRIRRQAPRYLIINGSLFRRGFSLPYLRCVSPPQREQILQELVSYELTFCIDPRDTLFGSNCAETAYILDTSESQFSSSILRFHYNSMRMPPSVYDYDMNTGISVLKKIETVLGGFDASNYVTERKWATASDGTQIPISIVYRKNLVKLDGSDLLLLYGYGSYEKKKYRSKEKLCIDGRSAGGLLIGAVLNMRPDLFKAAIAGVPFVDVVTTMLDPTIPLTTSEWEEWGDPRKEEFYFYMKSYYPVDNVKAQNYPNIFVTAGLNDPRVMYSEPAKFVAKLRELKTDDNILLFKCELGAGHFSKSGRFERLQEDAFIYTFILKALNIIPASASGHS